MPTVEDIGSEAEAKANPVNTMEPLDAALAMAAERPKDLGGDDFDDDEDIDESLGERLYGLTEMFPESLRNLTYKLTYFSLNSSKWLWSSGRTVAWLLGSSAAILVLPPLFEHERGLDEVSKIQQQKQMLLGPNAAVGGGGMPGMPQVMPPQAQR